MSRDENECGLSKTRLGLVVYATRWMNVPIMEATTRLKEVERMW